MHPESYARRNLVPLAVVGAFAVAGGYFATLLYADLVAWRAAIGGVAIGGFSGLCAVCHQLLE